MQFNIAISQALAKPLTTRMPRHPGFLSTSARAFSTSVPCVSARSAGTANEAKPTQKKMPSSLEKQVEEMLEAEKEALAIDISGEQDAQGTVVEPKNERSTSGLPSQKEGSSNPDHYVLFYRYAGSCHN
jgi:hypothetical protein